ncbi:MAG: imidazoleglycerol-phosphate dehydratase, partial [Microcystis sp. M53601_WE4]|nr:imidazoleglycerol-phosphate dehydratase [Microcystis sp. M53601_WE4]
MISTSQIPDSFVSPCRRASVSRTTKETDVQVT